MKEFDFLALGWAGGRFFDSRNVRFGKTAHMGIFVVSNKQSTDHSTLEGQNFYYNEMNRRT